jgi:nucleotide-binding universal stress UspA family protein
MSKIKTNKIIIPIDFSKTSMYAVKYAATLVKPSKGEIVLLNVQKKSDFIDIIMPALKLRSVTPITKFIKERLDKLAQDIRKKYGITVTSVVADGSIATEIVNLSKSSKAGLIVMGTHGKDSTNDLFMGSNAYRVLTKSKIPVMTVQKGADKSVFSRIILPIDMSAHSREKVVPALTLAASYGAQVHVVGLLHSDEKSDHYTLEVVLKQIQKLAEEKKVKVTGEIRESVNHAKETLAAAKKEKGDLIISMTDQEAEFSRIVLGTYIHQLINESKIPVLCVPPGKHASVISSDSIGGMW